MGFYPAEFATLVKKIIAGARAERIQVVACS